MPKAFDISMEIAEDMPVYPGDPGVEIRRVLSIDEGDPANVSLYCFGSHTGTHVDAPRHFINNGKSVDQLDLSLLVGEALVVDMTAAEREITRKDLEAHPEIKGQQKVLFKTKNSAEGRDLCVGFDKNYIAVGPEAARYLVEIGVQTVGIDYLSVEPFEQPGHVTHLTLLGNGIVPIEGLDLTGIEPGAYLMACLPLKVHGGNGAPARTILIEIEEEEQTP
ncbi:MAG: cyclase family protein [Chloroflexi bacterium]|nr:cyclase family protein [Chloroflexota bacterium]